MTSEVLILNKRAAVIAADSALSAQALEGEPPRYSKSVTKIFDVAQCGSIAVAIYGDGFIDHVPWELAIKLFRVPLGRTSYPTVAEYAQALVAFLSANDELFPVSVRDRAAEQQFDEALRAVVAQATKLDPQIADASMALAARREKWSAAAATIKTQLQSSGIAHPLSAGALNTELAKLPDWTPRAQERLAKARAPEAVDPAGAAELAHWKRYADPTSVLSKTGLVVAGYGEQQIFPAYRQIDVFGHIGSELYVQEGKRFEVTHEGQSMVQGQSMIQALAQTSMIDVFTDGFGASLWTIVRDTSKAALEKVFAELAANGVKVPAALSSSLMKSVHDEFMKDWMRQNWEKNFHPLIRVISTLGIDDMADLAETLVVLESVKERVTSSSESVGGPIDVAAITKIDGLVWIKRKHYFDAPLNVRHAHRVARSLDSGAG